MNTEIDQSLIPSDYVYIHTTIGAYCWYMQCKNQLDLTMNISKEITLEDGTKAIKLWGYFKDGHLVGIDHNDFALTNRWLIDLLEAQKATIEPITVTIDK